MKIIRERKYEAMGQKDKREKLLEDYEDVFSDIFNVLVFKDNIVKQEYLRDSSTVSMYKAENGNYREQLRDILKEYNNEFLLGVGSLGIANQSSIDKYMPVRVMGYDYTHYRSQIDKKQFPILPAITIVLNFQINLGIKQRLSMILWRFRMNSNHMYRIIKWRCLILLFWKMML